MTESDQGVDLESTTAELIRKNRDLESYAHLVAHDLKTPLQVITGFLELLTQRSADELDETSLGYIAEARRGAARMEHLIDDLLHAAVSSDATFTRDGVDLNAIVTDALSECVPTPEAAGAHVTIGELPNIDGSAVMLRRLFANLISNALKFRRPGTEAVVDITAVAGAEHWTINVTDNGIGVPRGDRDAVFTMFTRLDQSAQVPGSGIGLAVCQQIVVAHGGEIWITDGLDGGAQVCFTLPS